MFAVVEKSFAAWLVEPGLIEKYKGHSYCDIADMDRNERWRQSLGGALEQTIGPTGIDIGRKTWSGQKEHGKVSE